MGDSQSLLSHRPRAIAWLFILFGSLLILAASAWPLLEEWYSAFQWAAPEPSSAGEFEEFTLEGSYYYPPLGRPYVEWIYLVLFCIGVILHGRSLSQAHPRIAMASSLVVGVVCLYTIARLLIAGADAVSHLLHSTDWQYFFLLSPAAPQGTFGAGIVLAVAALAAAAATRTVVGTGLRVVSCWPTPG